MAKARKDDRGRALRKGEVQRASDKRYMYTYTDQMCIRDSLLSDHWALRTLLRRYPVLTGFQMFLVSCELLPRRICPSSFGCFDDP